MVGEPAALAAPAGRPMLVGFFLCVDNQATRGVVASTNAAGVGVGGAGGVAAGEAPP